MRRAAGASGGGTVLQVVSLAEAATGVLLLLAPGLVVRLILGEPPAGAGIAAARIAGAALVGLAVACTAAGPAAGLAVYSLGVTGVLVLTALAGGPAGALLWPVAALHLVIAGLLARR